MSTVRRRPVLVGLGLLLLPTPGGAQSVAPPGAAPATPPAPGTAPPVVGLKIGALLPVSGVSSWFGVEMRQGMQLAIAEINGEPARPAAAPGGPGAGGPPETTPAGAIPVAKPGAAVAPSPVGVAPVGPSPPAGPGPLAAPPTGTSTAAPGSAPVTGLAPAAPVAVRPPDLPVPGVPLVLEVLDVDPVDPKQAVERFGRLMTMQAPVVVTASVTPTLAIQPLAAARGVLVMHQGLVTGRFPVSSSTLVHTGPTLASRVDALVEHAWTRPVRRLAIVATGDDFGKAVRAELADRWRARGGVPGPVESVSLEAPDLASRLRQLARLGPDAVALVARGPELGDLARAAREAGHDGVLLALDDDPSAVLAGGSAVEGMEVVAEAFDPAGSARATRFATAYQARFGRAPSRYAARAYEAVVMIADAIQAARAERPGVTPGGSRLSAALRARRTFPSLHGGELRLRDDGTLERAGALFRVERGALVFVHYVGAGSAGAWAPPASNRRTG